MKEILVDHSIDGININKDIIPIAACNPYKLKEKYDMSSAGLKAEDAMAGI